MRVAPSTSNRLVEKHVFKRTFHTMHFPILSGLGEGFDLGCEFGFSTASCACLVVENMVNMQRYQVSDKNTLELATAKETKKDTCNKKFDPGNPWVGFPTLFLLAVQVGVFRPQIRNPHRKLFT